MSEKGKMKGERRNMVKLAFEEFEKLKSKDPVKAKRLASRGPADIYGLGPIGGGKYGTERTIIGHFRNGSLDYVEE